MKYKLIRNTIILLFILLLMILYNSMSFAGEKSIIINEIFFDPVGSDLGFEWIELYNPGEDTVNIIDWKILIAGTSFSETGTFSGQIEPHSYFLICEVSVSNCNINLQKIGMQNGGDSTDGLTIVTNQGDIIDQVFYDAPNSNMLKDYTLEVVEDTKTAEVGISGESLGRRDFLDTDDSRQDFYALSNPSPSTDNVFSLSDDEVAQTGDNPFFPISIFIISFFSGILIHNYKLFKNLNGKDS